MPVAAYPVTGPIDVIRPVVTGILDNDLLAAALQALHLSRSACRDFALNFTWEAATEQFLGNLAPLSERSIAHSATRRTKANDGVPAHQAAARLHSALERP